MHSLPTIRAPMRDAERMTPAAQAQATIAARGVRDPVDVAIVLDGRLGSVADNLEGAIVIPYAELPGFDCIVGARDGALAFVKHDAAHVAYMLGRAHYHETGDFAAMATPLETLALLGTQQFVLTDLVGSVRADYFPGNLVVVSDHISLGGANPLIGQADGGGYVNLTSAYDGKLSHRLKRAGALSGAPLHEGVYMWFSGPSFETPAEIRMARTLGADIVGNAIAPEVILCRRLGVNVAALTVITHFGAGFSGGRPNYADTIKQAQAGSIPVKRLLRAFLRARDLERSAVPERWEPALRSSTG